MFCSLSKEPATTKQNEVERYQGFRYFCRHKGKYILIAPSRKIRDVHEKAAKQTESTKIDVSSILTPRF